MTDVELWTKDHDTVKFSSHNIGLLKAMYKALDENGVFVHTVIFTNSYQPFQCGYMQEKIKEGDSPTHIAYAEFSVLLNQSEAYPAW